MENKTFIDFLIEVSEKNGYNAKWMKTGEDSDLGIFKCYQQAADLYAQQFRGNEPSEEEIRMQWSEWYDENGGNNTQDAWIEAITWYKQRIGRI